MGKSYRYRCEECGYEEEFFVGGSYMAKNYNRRVEEAEEELRSAVLYGKFGETIQHMMKYEREKVYINCDTDLYQCMDCRSFSVQMAKELSLNNSDFTLSVEFRHECPSCRSTLMRKSRGSITFCPQCKRFTAQLVSMGKFD